MKQTAMQDLREDLILTQEKVNDSLQIHNKEIREACQEVVRLTLSNIIKRIDEELLEMEKQQKGYSEEEVLELLNALNKISQFSDVGNDFLAVLQMKSIAIDSIKRFKNK
jgi:hypothetical protein